MIRSLQSLSASFRSSFSWLMLTRNSEEMISFGEELKSPLVSRGSRTCSSNARRDLFLTATSKRTHSIAASKTFSSEITLSWSDENNAQTSASLRFKNSSPLTTSAKFSSVKLVLATSKSEHEWTSAWKQSNTVFWWTIYRMNGFQDNLKDEGVIEESDSMSHGPKTAAIN